MDSTKKQAAPPTADEIDAIRHVTLMANNSPYREQDPKNVESVALVTRYLANNPTANDIRLSEESREG